MFDRWACQIFPAAIFISCSLLSFFRVFLFSVMTLDILLEEKDYPPNLSAFSSSSSEAEVYADNDSVARIRSEGKETEIAAH